MHSRAALAVLALLMTTFGARGAAAEEPKKPPAAPKSEPAPQGAPAAGGGAPGAPEVKKESTGSEGEKSYQFGAVEFEGRLKAPQILYFVRRVRAELQSGQLGHRSFFPELRDTRRSEVLR